MIQKVLSSVRPKSASSVRNVLFLGVGDPIPTFIIRRLNLLADQGISVTVLVKYDQAVHLDERVTLVRTMNWSKMNLGNRVGYLLIVALNFRLLFRILNLKKHRGWYRNLQWSMAILPLLRIKCPDLIHIQWILSADEWGWLKGFFNAPVVASARGIQVTVLPTVDTAYRNLLTRAFDNSDRIHCVSKDILNWCVRWGAPVQKLFVNYNGVDINEFQPRVDVGRSGQFVIISVGSLIWRKGIVYQLLMAKILIESIPDFQLRIVGSGPDWDGIVYQIARLGLKDHVVLMGATESVLSALQKADIYISTSAAEGLANSVVEACSCGLPCIVFDSEGMSEIVSDNETGFIVPYGAINVLAERVLRLFHQPAERAAFGQRARKKVVDGFDATRLVHEMIDEYRLLQTNDRR